MKKLMVLPMLAILLSLSAGVAAQDRCLAVKINKAGKPIVSLAKKNKKGNCRKGTIDQAKLVDTSTLEYGQVIATARVLDFGTPVIRSLGGSRVTSASVVKTDTGIYEVTFQGNFAGIESPEQIIRIGGAEFADAIITIPNVTLTPTSMTVLAYSQGTNGQYRNAYFNIMLTFGDLILQ